MALHPVAPAQAAGLAGSADRDPPRRPGAAILSAFAEARRVSAPSPGPACLGTPTPSSSRSAAPISS